jgi:glyoxylase-like metal-dependent hydrolase (beta-lactamase superfamily II)
MSLQASVYVVNPIPVLTTTPHTSNNVWQPISTTLIYGKKDAILVDTAWSVAQSEDLADWLHKTLEGRNLTTIYVTHGHGDHFFGGQTLKKHFPHVNMVATADTVKHVQQQIEPSYFASFWESILPADQLGNQTGLFVEALPEDGKTYLEGHLVQAIEVGQGDTYASTVFHVPSLQLVVCGDVVYGQAHQWLLETPTPDLMEAWITAIESIEALKPEIVIAGHKKPNEVVCTLTCKICLLSLTCRRMGPITSQTQRIIFVISEELQEQRLTPQTYTRRCSRLIPLD